MRVYEWSSMRRAGRLWWPSVLGWRGRHGEVLLYSPALRFD